MVVCVWMSVTIISQPKYSSHHLPKEIGYFASVKCNTSDVSIYLFYLFISQLLLENRASVCSSHLDRPKISWVQSVLYNARHLQNFWSQKTGITCQMRGFGNKYILGSDSFVTVNIVNNIEIIQNGVSSREKDKISIFLRISPPEFVCHFTPVISCWQTLILGIFITIIVFSFYAVQLDLHRTLKSYTCDRKNTANKQSLTDPGWYSSQRVTVRVTT